VRKDPLQTTTTLTHLLSTVTTDLSLLFSNKVFDSKQERKGEDLNLPENSVFSRKSFRTSGLSLLFPFPMLKLGLVVVVVVVADR